MSTNNNTQNYTLCTDRGVQFTMSNGITVSIMWGDGNYANHREVTKDTMTASTAEVAVWGQDGRFLRTPWNDDDQVVGWCTTDTVARLMDWCRGLRNEDGTLRDVYGIAVQYADVTATTTAY